VKITYRYSAVTVPIGFTCLEAFHNGGSEQRGLTLT